MGASAISPKKPKPLYLILPWSRFDDDAFLALLKSSKHIEHPLVFDESVYGENDTFQLDFLYLLSIRSRVDSLAKESFQKGKNRFGQIPTSVGFCVE